MFGVKKNYVVLPGKKDISRFWRFQGRGIGYFADFRKETPDISTNLIETLRFFEAKFPNTVINHHFFRLRRWLDRSLCYFYLESHFHITTLSTIHILSSMMTKRGVVSLTLHALILWTLCGFWAVPYLPPPKSGKPFRKSELCGGQKCIGWIILKKTHQIGCF